MRGAISVAVICDNEIFGRGLMACLREDPAIDASNGVDGSEDAPNVVVVSPTTLGSVPWRCPVLVCSDAPLDATGLDLPIAGILPRRSLTPDQLLSAVHAAAAGLHVGVLPTASPDLDSRTVEVLRLIAEGAGTREISLELGYSERTIKTVIAGAVRELGARSRAHAVAEAMRRALI